jgi:hypothetical protein
MDSWSNLKDVGIHSYWPKWLKDFTHNDAVTEMLPLAEYKEVMTSVQEDSFLKRT